MGFARPTDGTKLYRKNRLDLRLQNLVASYVRRPLEPALNPRVPPCNSNPYRTPRPDFGFFRSAPRASITNPDCISLLYTVCDFWGKNRPSEAYPELQKTLKSQGESNRAQPGKTPFLIYKTVALPLS